MPPHSSPPAPRTMEAVRDHRLPPPGLAAIADRFRDGMVRVMQYHLDGEGLK